MAALSDRKSRRATCPVNYLPESTVAALNWSNGFVSICGKVIAGARGMYVVTSYVVCYTFPRSDPPGVGQPKIPWLVDGAWRCAMSIEELVCAPLQRVLRTDCVETETEIDSARRGTRLRRAHVTRPTPVRDSTSVRCRQQH